MADEGRRWRGAAGDLASFVRVGTLDDPDRFSPDVNIHIESKQPWATLAPDIPAFEQFYKAAETWPPESIGRWQAMLGRK